MERSLDFFCEGGGCLLLLGFLFLFAGVVILIPSNVNGLGFGFELESGLVGGLAEVMLIPIDVKTLPRPNPGGGGWVKTGADGVGAVVVANEGDGVGGVEKRASHVALLS